MLNSSIKVECVLKPQKNENGKYKAKERVKRLGSNLTEYNKKKI